MGGRHREYAVLAVVIVAAWGHRGVCVCVCVYIDLSGKQLGLWRPEKLPQGCGLRLE